MFKRHDSHMKNPNSIYFHFWRVLPWRHIRNAKQQRPNKKEFTVARSVVFVAGVRMSVLRFAKLL